MPKVERLTWTPYFGLFLPLLFPSDGESPRGEPSVRPPSSMLSTHRLRGEEGSGSESSPSGLAHAVPPRPHSYRVCFGVHRPTHPRQGEHKLRSDTKGRKAAGLPPPLLLPLFKKVIWTFAKIFSFFPSSSFALDRICVGEKEAEAGSCLGELGPNSSSKTANEHIAFES